MFDEFEEVNGFYMVGDSDGKQIKGLETRSSYDEAVLYAIENGIKDYTILVATYNF